MTDAEKQSSPANRFPVCSSDAWLPFLREHGYVVLASAVSQDAIHEAKDRLWRDLEQAEADAGLSQADPRTWHRWRLPPAGLVPALAQSAGSWRVRGAPLVREAFAHIWGTADLIVSMDCAIVWRDWSEVPEWRPRTEGLHLDQNPFHKPGLECVQGMVPLLPVTECTGGLEVVPFSHTDEARERWKAAHPHQAQRGDWCPVMGGSAFASALQREARLLLAEPGDLILWDSRTVHGGRVGTAAGAGSDALLAKTSSNAGGGSGGGGGGGQQQGTGWEQHHLARISCTVSMTPRAWASPMVLEERRSGFAAGRCFNHSPHEAGTSTGTMRCARKGGYTAPDLTADQQALL